LFHNYTDRRERYREIHHGHDKIINIPFLRKENKLCSMATIKAFWCVMQTGRHSVLLDSKQKLHLMDRNIIKSITKIAEHTKSILLTINHNTQTLRNMQDTTQVTLTSHSLFHGLLCKEST
jgi:hypothetical protein